MNEHEIVLLTVTKVFAFYSDFV